MGKGTVADKQSQQQVCFRLDPEHFFFQDLVNQKNLWVKNKSIIPSLIWESRCIIAVFLTKLYAVVADKGTTGMRWFEAQPTRLAWCPHIFLHLFHRLPPHLPSLRYYICLQHYMRFYVLSFVDGPWRPQGESWARRVIREGTPSTSSSSISLTHGPCFDAWVEPVPWQCIQWPMLSLSSLSIVVVGLQVLSVVRAQAVDFINPTLGGGSMLNNGKFKFYLRFIC